MRRFKPGDRVVFSKHLRKGGPKGKFVGETFTIRGIYELGNVLEGEEAKYTVESTKIYRGIGPDVFFFFDSELSPIKPPEVFTDDEYKEFFI